MPRKPVVEKVWMEMARNGRYWVRNSRERITTRTLTFVDACSLVRFINR